MRIERCQCGADAAATTNGHYHYVECTRCPAAFDGACRSSEEAVAGWNRDRNVARARWYVETFPV